MSIANKLIYLNTTKEKLKDSINNIGGSITDETTFRAYATELDNIYTNLPKTTGEGSNLSLSPTLKGKLNIEAYKGDTSQFTTTGKNKLPNQLLSGSANGITYTRNEDGSIKLTGTATARTEPRLMTTSFTISAGTYKNTTSMTIYWYDTGYKAVASGSNVTFSSDTTIQYSYIRIESGTTINETIYPQFILSSESDTSYEQYTGGTASPNPSYPQDINVVTGTQEVVVQNKNLADTTAVNKGVTAQGNISSENVNYLGIGKFMKCKPSTTYTITFEDDIEDATLYVGYRDESGTFTRRTSYQTNRTFTTPNDVGEFSPYLYKTETTFVEGGYVMLELGSTATAYVPHQEQTKTLHLGDIELAKIGTYQDRISKSSGKQLFDKDTTKEGYLIQVNGEEVANASYGASDYIPIKANTYYTRTNCNNYYGAFYNTNKEFVGAITNANTIISSVDGYVRISFLLTNVDNVMLNEGSTALPYEPYGSGKWYIENKVGKCDVTGDETWRYSVSNVVFYADMLQDLAVVGTSILCNYFTSVANTIQYADMTNGQCKAENNTLKRFACKNTAYSDVTSFQNWLKSISMNIYYQMATPTYTEITNESLIEELNELEKMMSYNGQTNISVTGSLPMILSVSALKGE